MNSDIQSILSRSHLVNTYKFGSYLLAAFSLDTQHNAYFNPFQYSICLESCPSLFTSSLVDQLNHAILIFKSRFILEQQFFASNSSINLLLAYPNVLVILLEHSCLSLASRIYLIKHYFSRPFHLSPFCWSLLDRWYKALSLADMYKDSMELMYSNPPYISDGSTEVWSPHIGVSFGHLSFLFEHFTSIDFLTSNNKIVNASYISAPFELTAYSGLPFDRILDSSGISNFKIYDISNQVQSSTYIQLLDSSDSLARSNCLKRLDRNGYHNLCTLSSIPCSVYSNTLDTIYANDSSSFSKFNTSLDSYLSAKPIHDQISNFLRIYPTFLIIHSRDSAYTGNSQSFRDSNFDNFSLVVSYAHSLGIGVIRISTSANPTLISSDNFLDLSSLNDVGVIDQLYLLKRASYIIGTGSGISHWHCLNSCPTLFINTVVMHVSAFTDSVLLSPKRFLFDHRLVLDTTFLHSFATQWSSNLINQLQPRELSPLEILHDVQYFIDSYSHNQLPRFTLHSAITQLGISKEGIPDSIITRDYFHYLLGA